MTDVKPDHPTGARTGATPASSSPPFADRLLAEFDRLWTSGSSSAAATRQLCLLWFLEGATAMGEDTADRLLPPSPAQPVPPVPPVPPG